MKQQNHSKRCKKCKRRLPLTEFSKSGKYFQSECKKCRNKKAKLFYHRNRVELREKSKIWHRANRGQSYKKKYGISIDDHSEMLEGQNGVCAICGQPQTGFRRPLYVDHCHSTKVIRGLLCSNCNSLIGFALDDPSILEKAIQYLVRNRSDNFFQSSLYN